MLGVVSQTQANWEFCGTMTAGVIYWYYISLECKKRKYNNALGAPAFIKKQQQICCC